MNLLTKDLLINYLFILLFLCSAQMFYMIKYYRLKGLDVRVISILPVIAIILCMLFPVYSVGHSSWDFAGFHLF